MNNPPPNSEALSEDACDSADAGQRLVSVFDDARGEILGTLFYLVGNMEEARDVLQETFLKCWRNRQQIQTVDNLKAWIFRIALNTGRDARKTAWNRRRESFAENFAEEAIMVSTADGPDAGLMKDEELQTLQIAVSQLRPEEQSVFLLRQNGDLTYEQIAQATSLPIGTVKTRMRTAIRTLRQSVGGQS
ncbi:RNA polymerase sigma factor [Planctomycetes bacterium K23_9]|uniref:RNA polymerase sigma factor YlaC n=1 Tax=Stieleria marina TaxID=1930275 RepID=A0A517P1U1_9BACT|nr:RNA polymerase sigma factor YlaC [Planctomycetes bacterium K23_9]